MSSSKKNLDSSKVAKDDEYYTRIQDIENELIHYKAHFEGKVVLCNCDDPAWSNFYKYFSLKFNWLGLRKLITTHFEPNGTPSFALIYQDMDGDPVKVPLKGNGDFGSEECLDLLRQADIVVTNPPFSLFRNFFKTLIEHEKKFLIIGNMLAASYKEIYPFIQTNQLWLGVSKRGMDFTKPDGTKKPVNTVWYTNLSHKKRAEEIFLYQKYEGNEELYRRYDNCDAIDCVVNRDTVIPCDYSGLMGVPITWLDRYNPDQFELVRFRYGDDGKDLKIDGKAPFFRVLIRAKK